MTYVDVRLLHMGSAAATFALFLLRGAWMLWRPELLAQRWVRIVPHVIDTVFLASGIYLATLTHQYPFVHGWLTAKVFGLIAYIVLGSLALKHGRTRGQRSVAFGAAIVAFLYVVGVARAHHPASWVHLLG